MLEGQRAATIALLVALATLRCGGWIDTTPTYVVTIDPLAVYNGTRGLCFAINPRDPKGLWWWGPGRTGCDTRNTTATSGNPAQVNGTGALFHPGDATITIRSNGRAEAHFRLQLHGPPDFIDVDLIADGEHLRLVQTGAQVDTRNTSTLDVPMLAPFGRQF